MFYLNITVNLQIAHLDTVYKYTAMLCLLEESKHNKIIAHYKWFNYIWNHNVPYMVKTDFLILALHIRLFGTFYQILTLVDNSNCYNLPMVNTSNSLFSTLRPTPFLYVTTYFGALHNRIADVTRSDNPSD